MKFAVANKEVGLFGMEIADSSPFSILVVHCEATVGIPIENMAFYIGNKIVTPDTTMTIEESGITEGSIIILLDLLQKSEEMAEDSSKITVSIAEARANGKLILVAEDDSGSSTSSLILFDENTDSDSTVVSEEKKGSFPSSPKSVPNGGGPAAADPVPCCSKDVPKHEYTTAKYEAENENHVANWLKTTANGLKADENGLKTAANGLKVDKNELKKDSPKLGAKSPVIDKGDAEFLDYFLKHHQKGDFIILKDCPQEYLDAIMTGPVKLSEDNSNQGEDVVLKVESELPNLSLEDLADAHRNSGVEVLKVPREVTEPWANNVKEVFRRLKALKDKTLEELLKPPKAKEDSPRRGQSGSTSNPTGNGSNDSSGSSNGNMPPAVSRGP